MSIERWKNRRSERGVAMVEGGILAPIFAMMMMMTVYLGGVYQAKYQSFMDERNKTWTYVSNSCSGDGDKSESATGNTNLPSESNQAQGSQAQGRSDATAAMFIGHGKAQRTWDYTPTYKFNNGGPKTVTTEGWAVCNEKKYGHNVFSYLGGILGQVGSL
jgi:hypothetical protein